MIKLFKLKLWKIKFECFIFNFFWYFNKLNLYSSLAINFSFSDFWIGIKIYQSQAKIRICIIPTIVISVRFLPKGYSITKEQVSKNPDSYRYHLKYFLVEHIQSNNKYVDLLSYAYLINQKSI